MFIGDFKCYIVLTQSILRTAKELTNITRLLHKEKVVVKETPNIKTNNNREIAYALEHNSFIYYDETENIFKDYNDNIVEVNGIKVIPSSFVLQLPNMINALIKNGAIIPNTLEDISKVEEWYNYFETQRLIVSFTGKDLQDQEFLSYISEVFSKNPEVFLKTKKKLFKILNPPSQILQYYYKTNT